MKLLRLCCFFGLLSVVLVVQANDLQPTAASVLDGLKAGNQRYVSGHNTHPNESSARRQELATGQHPQAVFLTCADSRVAPEILFDQGLATCSMFVLQEILPLMTKSPALNMRRNIFILL